MEASFSHVGERLLLTEKDHTVANTDFPEKEEIQRGDRKENTLKPT